MMHKLRISFFDGEFDGDTSKMTHLCDVEGEVKRDLFNTLAETLRILELCTKQQDIPRPSGVCFTALVANDSGAAVVPLLRIDVHARNGSASAGVIGAGPRWDTEPVCYGPGDDAVEIVRKILAAQVPDDTLKGMIEDGRA